MRVLRLLRDVLSVLAAGSLVAWWTYGSAFPVGPEAEDALRTTFIAGIAAELVVAALALARASAPLRRAAAAGWNLGEEERAIAVASGRRLPALAATVVLLASAATSSAAALAMHARGTPPDLALAAAAVGVASAVFSAALAHSAASSAARASLELGERDAAVGGTVRGKIVVLAFGLETIGLLLFAAIGYVRYRGDVDREYVAAAARALEVAVEVAGPGADAELARQVWLATSSPSALVGPGGAIVARFGPGDLPFHRALAAPPGSIRLEEGWLVTTNAPGGGVVASWLPEAPLRPRRRALLAELAAAGLVVYAATALLAWLAAGEVTLPLRTLGRAADRIASGDLTATPRSTSRDEVGRLAAELRRMAEGLKALVVDVQAASEGLSHGAREASAIGEKVRSGVPGEHAGAAAMQAVEAMDGSIHLVSRGMGGISEHVAAGAHTMGGMSAALDEVQKKGTELQHAMDAALRDVERLAAAVGEAEGHLSELEGLAGRTGGALDSVRETMAGLERAASEGEATSTIVAEAAERAGLVVEETAEGIAALRAAVSDAHRRIASLGRRSDDIDRVVELISEVAGRTNLLSLNASIIASQAGEHGKAFAVVADQIRELAAQIARSTTSIDGIVHSVREDLEGTAALVGRGDALAADGVRLARSSLDALGQLRRSAGQGREIAASIRAAANAHGRSSREVGNLAESVAEGARAAAAAVVQVGRSAGGVSSASRSADALADEVARALEEQAGLGRRQAEVLGRLERMIADVTRAVQDHGAAARRVGEAVRALSQTAGEHASAVEGLTGVARSLGSRARALAESVARFKV